MKKGFKLTIASALALSALTPVAAFADETPAPAAANGFYTADSFLTPVQFKNLTKVQKAELLVKEDLVLVVAGTVYFAKDAIGKSDAELVELAISEADFEAEHGALTESGYEADDVVTGLTVESVSAITETTVDVAITAPEEDVLGATVVVKDSEGTIVEVNTTDISAGDKVASFTFKTAVKADALTGVWSVDGKEYSFDAINQLTDITDAASASPLNEVKLLAALNAAGIQNVDDNRLADYADAIVDASPEVLADVQTAVDATNKTAAEGATEAAAVKTVEEATNQIQLLAALEANFDFVNADWIAAYTNGAPGSGTDSVAGFIVELVKTDANTTVVEYGKTQNAVALTFKNIQETINNVNDVQVAAAYDKAFKSLKTADVTTARTLANTYISVDEDATLTKKDWANDSLDVLDALIRVNAATTNNSLKTALVALDTLETTLVDKYKTNSIGVTVSDDFKIKDVNDNLLADYRKAISDETDVTKKNQRGDIQIIIAKVNGDSSIALIKAVNDAAKESTVDADKLLKALNALNLKQVAASNKATYAANTDYQTAVAGDVQDKVDADNIKAIKALKNAGDGDKLITALNVIELKNVKPENKDAYVASAAVISGGADGDSIGQSTTPAKMQDAVDAVNSAELDKAEVKAINEATTAAEVKTALDKLAITSYVNVPTADKLHIAEKVLEARDAVVSPTAKEFANKAAVTTALDTVSSGVIAKYDALVAEFKLSALTDISTTVTNLSKLGYDAFDNLSAGEKSKVAEVFVTNYPTDDNGAVNYVTLSSVKKAIDAAIAAPAPMSLN